MGLVEEGSERASGVGKCGIEWAGLGVVWCVSCMIQIAIPGRDLLCHGRLLRSRLPPSISITGHGCKKPSGSS